jgi:hypothetical protein
MLGEAFDAARALAEMYQLSPDAATLFDADMSTDDSGVMKDLDLSYIPTMLTGIGSISTVATADSNALRKATYALSARNR